MICKYCQEENVENAVFCKNCGKRIDGKNPCPKCNTLIEENAVYCTVCGARIDGKKVCPNCGTVYDGNFCPTCGAGTKPVKPQAVAGGSSMDWKKVLSKVGLSLGFAGAVLAFIFMFFMGITLSGTYDSDFSKISGLGKIAIFNIFDCFGNNFNFVSELETMSKYTVVPTIYYFYAIMKLIVATATIVCTTTFLILAVYRFVNTMRGEQTKSAESMIFATIISFVAGAVSFKTLIYAQLKATSSFSDSASMIYSLNGTTVAGIVISLIFAAIMFGFKIAVIAPSLRKTALAKTIISGGCAIFAIILLLALGGQITFSETGSSYMMKITTGFVLILGGALSAYSTYREYYANQSTADTAIFIGIVGHIITFALIIILAIFIVYAAIKTIDDKKKSSTVGIVYSSILLFLAIVFMVFSILGKNISIDILNLPTSVISKLTALPYIGIVITLILLAAEITYAVIKRRIETLSNGNAAEENA